MPSLFYYRHYITAYDKHTKDLTMLEHGAYRLLMDGYYAKGLPLPAAEERLFLVAKAMRPEDQDAVRRVVAMFFVRDGDVLRHQRCDEEVARCVAESEKQAAKANKRWMKEADSASGDAAASATEHAAAKPTGSAAGHARKMPVKIQDSKRASPLPPAGDEPFVVPAWVPPVQWSAFLKMRRQIKKPCTERSMMLAVNKLDELRAIGHDPGRVLDQSTENCWAGLFALKNPPGGGEGGGKRASTETRNEQTASDWAGADQGERHGQGY